MIIEFSRHAIQRLRERRISMQIIKEALAQARRTEHIEGDKFTCYYRINSETLVVVFIKRKEYYKIVTAFYEDNL